MNNSFYELKTTQDDSRNSRIKESRSVWNEIYEWVDCAVITVVCLLLVFTFIFRQVKIDGSSMEKTLFDGERVIVSDMFYTPQYGDIVVISSEIYDNVPIIKRVIATEGQWIDIHDGNVYVGDNLEEMKQVGTEFIGDTVTEETVGSVDIYGRQEYPLLVPQNMVFVMGDNRTVSLDSRTEAVGLIDERFILGKALYRVYPFSEFGSIY